MATSGNHSCHQGTYLPSVEVTFEELERPAKELPLEGFTSDQQLRSFTDEKSQERRRNQILRQLGLKLITRHGNWVRVAESLGYSRDKIDEFENEALIMREPAGFLVLKDWTKEEDGRSLYVLRECLRQCGRLDCVTYLDQEIKDALSMNLLLKLVDETDNSRRFISVPTKCYATLQDSLQNVLDGSMCDYEINADWRERARKFKGMHLLIKRIKRPNLDLSQSKYQLTNIRQRPGSPYNDLSGNSIVHPRQTMNFNLCTEAVSKTGVGEGNQITWNTQEKIPQMSYVANECVYCGRFITSQIRQNFGAARQLCGVYPATCNCDVSNIEGKNLQDFTEHKPISDNHVSSSSSQPMAVECPMEEQETKFKGHDYCNEQIKKPKCGEHSGKLDIQTAVTYTNVSTLTVKQGFVWHQPTQQFLEQDEALMKTMASTKPYTIIPSSSPIESGSIERDLSDSMMDIENVATHETFVKTPFGEESVINPEELICHRRERSVSEPTELYQALLHGVDRNQRSVSSCENVYQQPIQGNGTCHVTLGESFLQFPAPSRCLGSSRSISNESSKCEPSSDISTTISTSQSFQTNVAQPGIMSHPSMTVEDHTESVSGSEQNNHAGNTGKHTRQLQPIHMEEMLTAQLSNTKELDCQPDSSNLNRYDNIEIPPQLPPRPSANRKTERVSFDKTTDAKELQHSSESKFTFLCAILKNCPGWCPKETEVTAERTMDAYLRQSGHYMIWYMRQKNTIVLTVSHLDKLVHYGIYLKWVRNKLVFYIFEGEYFADLPMLLNHYIQNGLKPRSQQAYPANDQQWNVCGSRMRTKLSHVKLLYPVRSKRGRTSV